MRVAFSTLAGLISLAGTVAAEDLVFPFVDQGEPGADSDFFSGYEAKIIDIKNDLTTYSVGCATVPCGRYTNSNPAWTIKMNQNTFDWTDDNRATVSFHTACTFTGNPVTAASCEDTVDWSITETTVDPALFRDYELHWTVPATENDLKFWAIMSATWKLVDGSVTPTATPASGASGGSGSAQITSVPTTTESATSAQAPESVQSSGLARSTGVPAAKYLAGMGIAAGAIFAL